MLWLRVHLFASFLVRSILQSVLYIQKIKLENHIKEIYILSNALNVLEIFIRILKCVVRFLSKQKLK